MARLSAQPARKSRDPAEALLRIGITTGDADGIGSEVISKALRKLGPQKGVRFYLWRSPSCPQKHLGRIDSKFKRATFHSWTEAQAADFGRSPATLVDICSHLPPPKWVETAAEACSFRRLDGMVTGPLSKTLIIKSGMKDLGHTSILKRVAQVDDVFMGFFGMHFNVALVTDHVPLKNVSEKLTTAKLETALRTLLPFSAQLTKGKVPLPVAVLGLNPHAGEEDLLGTEESKVIIPVLEKLRAEGHKLVGPLVPDAAFLKQNWDKFSLFVALYHDQGLIPFKAFHGQRSGVHISIGLPFVRTSVDHGTAKDIFGKEIADARSMIEALEWGIRLARTKVNS